MTTYVHERAVVQPVRTLKCRPLHGICQQCRGDGCFQIDETVLEQNVGRSKTGRNAASLLATTVSSLVQRQHQKLVQCTPAQDRDLALVVETARYYNEHMLPSTTPAQLPFKRNAVPLDYWPLLPLALRHTWIVMVKTRQAFEASTEPMLQPGLCYYRGRGLSLLHDRLAKYQEAVEDPWAVTLMSILFFMGADMQLCEEHWTIHLEAARKLIGDRGGLLTCLQLPTTGPLLNYMNADILTSTTCQPWVINPRALKSQYEYLRILPKMGPQLLEHGHACPVDVLTAITYTNILRVTSRRPLTVEELLLVPEQITFDKARMLLDDFDCAAWAMKASLAGRRLPQRAQEELAAPTLECLTSLAKSYQAAAMLYLLLTVNVELVSSNAILEAQTVLSRTLSDIFDNASIDHNGPLHGQLWKFTAWPLFVSAYVKAGWDVGAESIELAMDRFAGIGMILSSTRLLKIPGFLREIKQRRMQSDKQWRWDEGFGSRLAYVL